MKIILCLILSMSVFTQGQQITTKIEDFNSDGYLDTLKYWSESGSGFGGKYCTIINGASQKNYELNTSGCFCRIKKKIEIPVPLMKKENEPFLETVQKQILPHNKKATDPSLQWIIEAGKNNKFLTDNPVFDLIISSPTKWLNSPVKLPNMYYTNIIEDGIAKWLIYYAHNHYRNGDGDSLILAGKTKIYQAYKTSHAILVKKEHKFAWLFVNDYDLVGGPGKLRWESIGKLQIYKHYIVFQQSLAPDMDSRIFIIDIETGVCGRLKFKTALEDFRLEKADLFLKNETDQKSFLLDVITNQLKI